MQGQTKPKGVVDIVFLLDVTGSMDPCLGALKNNIGTFVASLTTQDSNNSCPVKDWRAKVVGYRDFEDPSAPPFEDNPFVNSTEALRSQLAALDAKGGGDEEESLLDALYLVAKMDESPNDPAAADPTKWRHRRLATRVMIVFTDAPFKERMSAPQVAGGGFEDLKNEIKTKKIILSLYAPDMSQFDDTLAQLNKSEYNAIPCKSDQPGARQAALAEFTSNQENFKKTLRQLAASLSASASQDLLVL